MLYFFDESSGQWSTAGITVTERDTINNRITVTITHLTMFALFAPSAGTTTDLILVSSATNGKIGSFKFNDEDILAYDPVAQRWLMYFDGSDVGVGNADLDAFHVMADGSLLMSFDKPLRTTALGVIADADIVKFTPFQLGNNTSGAFSLYFDGSAVGLTAGNEDIDALALDADGNLVISTLGTATVDGLVGRDEDLLRFTATSLGAETSGTWALYFDGSAVALNAGAEDVGGLWIDPTNADLYLTVKGNFLATGSTSSISGDRDDIFGCVEFGPGETTDCFFFAYFDGDLVDFNRVIDGISVMRSAEPGQVQQLVQASNDAAEGEQFATLPDEPTDSDLEVDEFDQAVEAEELPQRFFLPLITR